MIEKLEKIRRDPQLNNYVVAKTKQIEKNLEELSRTESMENEKRKEEIRKYGDSFSRYNMRKNANHLEPFPKFKNNSISSSANPRICGGSF